MDRAATLGLAALLLGACSSELGSPGGDGGPGGMDAAGTDGSAPDTGPPETDAATARDAGDATGECDPTGEYACWDDAYNICRYPGDCGMPFPLP